MVQQIEDEDLGIKILYEPNAGQNVSTDIVAVHGLAAHPDHTWTKKRVTGTVDKWVNWLEEPDMLPAVVHDVRISRYGYRSNWFGSDSIRRTVGDVALKLLLAIHRQRKNCPDRPLLFVAHSFGGLVVLRAIRDAYLHREDWPHIFGAVVGLVFLGTPFRGAEGMSQSEMIQAALREHQMADIEGGTLQILDPGNEVLGDLVDDFCKAWSRHQRAQIACFYELQASEIGAIVGKQRRRDFAVSKTSACLDFSEKIKKFPLSKNHFNMNKFASPREEDFLMIADVIEEMVRTRNKFESVIAQGFQKLAIEPSLTPSRHTSPTQTMVDHLEEDDPDLRLDMIEDHQQGTLIWIPCHEAYVAWIAASNGNNDILWLRGEPGSGKSVAFKYLLRHAKQDSGNHSNVAYFCCVGSNDKMSTGVTLMRSILMQILRQDPVLEQLISNLYNERLDQPRTRQWPFLWDTFLSILRTESRKPIYVFLDAVDEMNSKDRRRLLENISLLYRTKPINTPKHLKMLISSRPWQEIHDALFDYPTVNLTTSEGHRDVELFITQSVRAFGKRESFPPGYLTTIESQMKEKSKGLFLWASLAWSRFTAVSGIWTRAVIEEKMEELDRMPSGVRDIIIFILQNLDFTGELIRILQWLVYARRPLTLDELNTALSIRPDVSRTGQLQFAFNLKRDVERICGPLVSINPTDNTVHLYHQSVHEFFSQTAEDSEDSLGISTSFRIDPKTANEVILEACLRFLCLVDIWYGPADNLAMRRHYDTIDSYIEQLDEKTQFLIYALDHWDEHLPQPPQFKNQQERQKLRIEHFARLAQYDVNVLHRSNQHILHFAADYGLTDAIRNVLRQEDVHVNEIDTESATPLHKACYRGHREAAHLLVEAGAWKGAFIKDQAGNRVIDLVLQQDMEDVACRILEKWSTNPPGLNTPDPRGHIFTVEAVKLSWTNALNLLSTSQWADFEQDDTFGNLPIHCAAKSGNVRVMQILIVARVSLDTLDKFGRSVLHHAVKNDSVEMIRMSLEAGANPNLPDNEGATPLHQAMENDLIKIAKMLFQSGADPNASDSRGMTPLHQAALYGHANIVDWLITQPQCEENAASSTGNTAIHWAAQGRHHKVVELLLRSPKVKKSLNGAYRRNLLHLCLPWADSAVIRGLLTLKRIDPFQSDDFGSTPLHVAAKHGSIANMDLILLKYGGRNIDPIDKHGNTPLHLAARMARALMVKRLLAAGADPSILNADGHTAEFIAANSGSAEVLHAFEWPIDLAQKFVKDTQDIDIQSTIKKHTV